MSSMALDGLKLLRNPPAVTLIVATAVTRASAMADVDAAAALAPLLLLGVSDRADDDDDDATHPMVFLRDQRRSWTRDDDGRLLSEEEGEEEEEAATWKKRNLAGAGPRAGAALLQRLRAALRNGLSWRCMLPAAPGCLYSGRARARAELWACVCASSSLVLSVQWRAGR